MGAATCTVQSLIIVRVDAERQLLLVRGAVPGHRGSDVIVKPAAKPGKPRAAAAGKASKDASGKK